MNSAVSSSGQFRLRAPRREPVSDDSALILQLRWRIHALEAENGVLRDLAARDAMTGLRNRGTGEALLAREMRRARRFGRQLSVLIFDVDRFKSVNDGYGHPAGDAVLRCVAARCTAQMRDYDTAVRWGGDEFLVIAPEIGLAQARELAERLRQSIGAAALKEFQGLKLSVSIGMASLDEERFRDETPCEFVERADTALRAAKDAGRNRACA